MSDTTTAALLIAVIGLILCLASGQPHRPTMDVVGLESHYATQR